MNMLIHMTSFNNNNKEAGGHASVLRREGIFKFFFKSLLLSLIKFFVQSTYFILVSILVRIGISLKR